MPDLHDMWSAALPDLAVSGHSAGPHPRARIGWAGGNILVGDAAWESTDAAPPGITITEAASRLARSGAGALPIVDGDQRLIGMLYIDDLLAHVAGDPGSRLVSTLTPACRPESTLLDAARQMVTCYLRHLPIIDPDGKLLGQLPFSEAVAHADRDPTLRDFLAANALSPSLWARRWR